MSREPFVQSSAPLYLTCDCSRKNLHGTAIGKSDRKTGICGDLCAPPEVICRSSVSECRYRRAATTKTIHCSVLETKSDFTVEYRPVKDLLIRGTSRGAPCPTVNDLYASPVKHGGDIQTNPCNGLTLPKEMAATHPNSCTGSAGSATGMVR